jgi:ribosomal protein L14E/L6E/L27E
MMEPGRICIISRGSDAGKEVVVNEASDNNFVIVSGEKVKQRRINIKHLEPTPRTGAIIVPVQSEKPKKAAPKKKADEKK